MRPRTTSTRCGSCSSPGSLASCSNVAASPRDRSCSVCCSAHLPSPTCGAHSSSTGPPRWWPSRSPWSCWHCPCSAWLPRWWAGSVAGGRNRLNRRLRPIPERKSMTAQIITACPVPFTESGEVDASAYTAAMEAIHPHVHGALIAGTTGEFPALEDDERIELFRLAVQVLGPKRVVAHLGHGSTRQVLRLAERTEALGITRFALLTPYYLPTDDVGVVAFFEALTSRYPNASIYPYLFPERTGMDIPVPVLE